MKRIKTFSEYSLLEGLDSLSPIPIDKFLEEIGIGGRKKKILDWWKNNRDGIKIYYFPFSSVNPIGGCFFGKDTVCINSKIPFPPHMKLFLCLHESRHCDQYAEDKFMEGYFQTVVDGDRNSFLETYSRLEKDANDFAISGMREMGFSPEMDREERSLRGNEGAGPMVFNMMSSDIARINPVDFFDLLRNQIF